MEFIGFSMSRIGYKHYTKDKKLKARAYRRNGLSLKEISLLMRIPKGTIGNWVRDIELNDEQKDRLNEKERKNLERHISRCRLINFREVAINKHKRWYDLGKQIILNENGMIGLIIYVCEGSHSYRTQAINVVNSNYILLVKFMELVENVFNVSRDKWRVLVNIHPYHVDGDIKEYWHKKLNIDKNKIKTYVQGNGGRRLRENYMGCARIEICDIEIRCKLEGLIDKYLERQYYIEKL